MVCASQWMTDIASAAPSIIAINCDKILMRMQRPPVHWRRCIHAMASVICHPFWSTMVADTQCSLRRWARLEYFPV